MKIVNFIGIHEDERVKSLLCWCWSAGFDYHADVKPLLDKEGYYVPQGQYDAFCKVLDIQLDLDMESREQ